MFEVFCIHDGETVKVFNTEDEARLWIYARWEDGCHFGVRPSE